MSNWMPVVHDILVVVDQIFPLYIYWYLHRLATESREDLVRLEARVARNDRRDEDILYRFGRDIGALRVDIDRLKQSNKARQRSAKNRRREVLQ